jgi:large subunit ribosomal protein L21
LPGRGGDICVYLRFLQIVLNKVLLVGTPDLTVAGTPLVTKAKVYACCEEQTLTDKILVFKKKRRKNYKRLRGWRHPITGLRITGIDIDY